MNLLIADDHQIFREGIAELISNHKLISSIFQAKDGKEALKIIHKNSIQIILMDINMPEMNGIETSIQIKKKYPEIKIIMLTMHDTQNYIKTLLDIGVDGYLLKTTSKEEIDEAILTVSKNEKYYGQAVQKTFIESFTSKIVSQNIKLTKREKEILILICDEFSTAEIADKLHLSRHTVESHRKNLLAKTGSKNLAGLVKFAIQNKFI